VIHTSAVSMITRISTLLIIIIITSGYFVFA